MNWSGILKYSFIHFFFLTALSTLINLLVGSNNLINLPSINFILYFYLPSFIGSVVILFAFAIKQRLNTFIHLLAILGLSSFISTAIVSILIGEVTISSSWYVDYFFLFLSALGALLASNIKKKRKAT